MKVIVYGDYVCPFCFLEVPALERLGREDGVEIDYRAYELRPDPVPTLDPRGDYLVTTWRNSVYPLAERLGVPVQLPPVQPRSRLAFEGLEFARDHGRLTEYNKAVYEAFFQQGRDIGNIDVLAEIASGVGLDAVAFRAALEDHRYLERVLEQEKEAAEVGIDAVPATIIGDYLLRGCVPYESLRRAVGMVRDAASQPRNDP